MRNAENLSVLRICFVSDRYIVCDFKLLLMYLLEFVIFLFKIITFLLDCA